MSAVIQYPVSAIVARLEAIAELNVVELAAGLKEATENAPATVPAVYVLSNCAGGDVSFTGPPLQQERTTSIKLVVWVRNSGKASALRADMEEVLSLIDQSLMGFTPSNPPFAPLTFVRSRDEFSARPYLVVSAEYSAGWEFSNGNNSDPP